MRKIISVIKMLIKVPFNIFNKVSPFSLIRNSKISNKAAILGGGRIYNCQINDYSYLGRMCFIVNCEVGKFCSIADNVTVGMAEHPINWLSTSPVFGKGNNILKENFSNHQLPLAKKTVIENDVWIGMNVSIKQGVKIGNGAIIGTASVVTKDVPAYSIVAGVPARVIRYRFSDEIINELEQIKWWNLDIAEIKHIAAFSNDIEKVIEYFDIKESNKKQK